MISENANAPKSAIDFAMVELLIIVPPNVVVASEPRKEFP
jgi:hypothetical protein